MTATVTELAGIASGSSPGADALPALNRAELLRYSRHLINRESSPLIFTRTVVLPKSCMSKIRAAADPTL